MARSAQAHGRTYFITPGRSMRCPPVTVSAVEITEPV